MIEAKVQPDRIRRVYDITSRFYGVSAALFDRKARRRGLERTEIRRSDRVLEVGTGPGISLGEIAGRVDPGRPVAGVEISRRMLDLARRRLNPAVGPNQAFVQADGCRLPFRNASFDVVFSAYVRDLQPLSDITAVLEGFQRVLRPGGRLVLVSLTRGNEARRSWWERVYSGMPPWAAAWILGPRRPVLLSEPVRMAGFVDVTRELIHQFLPSEIVVATKPAA